MINTEGKKTGASCQLQLHFAFLHLPSPLAASLSVRPLRLSHSCVVDFFSTRLFVFYPSSGLRSARAHASSCIALCCPLSLSLFSSLLSVIQEIKQESSSRPGPRKKSTKKMICPFVAIGIQGFTDNKASLYLAFLLAG